MLSAFKKYTLCAVVTPCSKKLSKYGALYGLPVSYMIKSGAFTRCFPEAHSPAVPLLCWVCPEAGPSPRRTRDSGLSVHLVWTLHTAHGDPLEGAGGRGWRWKETGGPPSSPQKHGGGLYPRRTQPECVIHTFLF